MKQIRRGQSDGFILPSVLLIGLGVLVIGLALLQASSSVRASTDNRYYQKLASEAAEAGSDYAAYCLASNSYTQTWGPAAGEPPLTQSTDCNGQPLANAVNSVSGDSTSPSSFSVGDTTRGADGTYIIHAVGSASRSSSALGTIQSFQASTYQAVGSNLLKASLSAAGHSKTCGVIGGAAYCWGQNSGSVAGQLGDGTNTDSTTPVKVVQENGVMAGKTVTALATGYYHVCAVAGGGAYCWGQNYDGQLGNGTTNPTSKPIAVGGPLAGKTVTAIATPYQTTCAIADGKIYCWGDNSDGTAGTSSGSTRQYLTPTLITNGLPANYTATSLATSAAESQTMCAIIAGNAYCWGDNRSGAVGNGTDSTTPVYTPTPVSTAGALAGKTVSSISIEGHSQQVSSASPPHACVVASDSQAYCWGDNSFGQLGLGDTTQRDSPTLVTAFAGKVVQGIAAGVQHTCVLANAWVYCMGTNQFGQQGNNGTMASGVENHTPVAIVDANGVLTDKTISGIGGGANRTCVFANYITYCWGFNSVGQIGDGTTINRNVPTLAKYLQPPGVSYLF